MKVINGRCLGRDLYFENYVNYDEFLRTVLDRDENNNHDSEYKLKETIGSKSWSGVSSVDEAKELLMNGWNKEIETLKKTFNSDFKTMQSRQVNKRFNDVVGFMPIVPNAIIGLPISMINTRKEVKKQKVLRFLVDATKACRYDYDEIVEKMSKILAVIANFEKSGYRCKIEILETFSQPDERKTIIGFSIPVKNETQLFDIKRLAFPIIHSAMSRVFGFSWQASLPLEYKKTSSKNLGKSLCYWGESKRNEVLNSIQKGNEKMIYVSMETDIDELLKEVKE